MPFRENFRGWGSSAWVVLGVREVSPGRGGGGGFALTAQISLTALPSSTSLAKKKKNKRRGRDEQKLGKKKKKKKQVPAGKQEGWWWWALGEGSG